MPQYTDIQPHPFPYIITSRPLDEGLILTLPHYLRSTFSTNQIIPIHGLTGDAGILLPHLNSSHLFPAPEPIIAN